VAQRTNGVSTRYFVPGTTPLLERTGDGLASQSLVYTQDGRANITGLWNGTQYAAKFHYDAFGNVTTTNNANQQIANTSGPRYGGEFHDAATDQIYLRNRYYDPKIGAFQRIDPIGFNGGLNLYGYCGGDPLNFHDPMGTLVHYVGDKNGINNIEKYCGKVSPLQPLDVGELAEKLHLNSNEKSKLASMASNDNWVWRVTSDHDLKMQIRAEMEEDSALGAAGVRAIPAIQYQMAKNMVVSTAKEVVDQVKTAKDARDTIVDTQISYAVGDTWVGNYFRTILGVNTQNISEQGIRREQEVRDGVPLAVSIQNSGEENVHRAVQIVLPAVFGRLAGTPLGTAAKSQVPAASRASDLSQRGVRSPWKIANSEVKSSVRAKITELQQELGDSVRIKYNLDQKVIINSQGKPALGTYSPSTREIQLAAGADETVLLEELLHAKYFKGPIPKSGPIPIDAYGSEIEVKQMMHDLGLKYSHPNPITGAP
jgi:RHS repeat-associated protein